MNRKTLGIIAVAILTIAIASLATFPLGPAPDPSNNQTPTPTPNETQPYAQPENLTLNTVINTTTSANTFTYTEHYEDTRTIESSNRTITQEINRTIYYYANDTTQTTASANWSEQNNYSQYKQITNNSTVSIKTIEQLNNGELSSYTYTGGVTNTTTRINPRATVTTKLQSYLSQPTTITEISVTQDTIHTTYEYENGTFTVTDQGRLTHITTPNRTLTIEYGQPLPDQPPRPESDIPEPETTPNPQNNSTETAS